MEIPINYRENLFEKAKLTPIRGEPTFKTLHKLQNEIKDNDVFHTKTGFFLSFSGM